MRLRSTDIRGGDTLPRAVIEQIRDNVGFLRDQEVSLQQRRANISQFKRGYSAGKVGAYNTVYGVIKQFLEGSGNEL